MVNVFFKGSTYQEIGSNNTFNYVTTNYVPVIGVFLKGKTSMSTDFEL